MAQEVVGEIVTVDMYQMQFIELMDTLQNLNDPEHHEQLIMSIDRTRDEIENLSKVISKCFHILIQEISGKHLNLCDNCGCDPVRRAVK